jgi:ribonuclease R
VIDVRNFGFFVDVSGLAMSGLVPLSQMQDDFYVFDPVRNQLIGRRSRRMIRLGDKVTVQVAKVDTFKKQVDFRLVEERRKSIFRSSPGPQKPGKRISGRVGPDQPAFRMRADSPRPLPWRTQVRRQSRRTRRAR